MYFLTVLLLALLSVVMIGVCVVGFVASISIGVISLCQYYYKQLKSKSQVSRLEAF